MKKKAIPKLNRIDGMSWVWAAVSRAAVLLTAFVVLFMPLTEHLWHFDNFLRGGQDFELGLLSIATIACLVMVMLHHGKCLVSMSLSLRHWLSTAFNKATIESFIGLIAALHVTAVPGPFLGQYTLPLQV
jgi:hypothetical protein